MKRCREEKQSGKKVQTPSQKQKIATSDGSRQYPSSQKNFTGGTTSGGALLSPSLQPGSFKSTGAIQKTSNSSVTSSKTETRPQSSKEKQSPASSTSVTPVNLGPKWKSEALPPSEQKFFDWANQFMERKPEKATVLVRNPNLLRKTFGTPFEVCIGRALYCFGFRIVAYCSGEESFYTGKYLLEVSKLMYMDVCPFKIKGKFKTRKISDMRVHQGDPPGNWVKAFEAKKDKKSINIVVPKDFPEWYW